MEGYQWKARELANSHTLRPPQSQGKRSNPLEGFKFQSVYVDISTIREYITKYIGVSKTPGEVCVLQYGQILVVVRYREGIGEKNSWSGCYWSSQSSDSWKKIMVRRMGELTGKDARNLINGNSKSISISMLDEKNDSLDM